jgi:hypothetical protein
VNSKLQEAYDAHFKRLNRRAWVAALLPFGAALLSWLGGLNNTQKLIIVVGACVLAGLLYIDVRLKTMQVRLAQMHDQIKHGEWTRDPDNREETISELSGW